MHNILPLVVFYVFAGLTIFSALMVITQNNPVRCVLFLVLGFLASAVLWILVEAEFLGLILVLVYVGAVMTLFLFVVMMLNIDIESMRKEVLRRLPFGLLLVALLTAILLGALPKDVFQHAVKTQTKQVLVEAPKMMTNQRGEVPSDTIQLGTLLYTQYGFAFEMAAAILLVAIIASITLTHRPTGRSKRQSVLAQIMTRGEDRLRVVSMKAEKE